MIAPLETRLAALEARLALVERRALPMAPETSLAGFSERTRRRFGRLLAVVGHEFNVAPAELTGGCREPHSIMARFAAVWTTRELLKLSYPQLGRMFAKPDHTSVLHAFKRAEGWRETDPDFKRVTDMIVQQLRAEFAEERS